MLFTPHLFAFLEDGQKQSLTASSLMGQKLCLIPRDQCSFRRIKIAGKHKKALQAAEFRVRQESDSDENKFIIIPDDDGARASVWGFQTYDQHQGRYIPESLALQPMDEGVRLVTLLIGYEGQVWNQGHIVASRWWAQKPNAKKWTAFLYSAQGDYETDSQVMPAEVSLPYRTDLPIFKIGRDRAAKVFSPAKLGRVAALAIGCGVLFISGQFIRNQMMLNTTENDIEALSSITAQISSERRRAISNRRQAQKYDVVGHPGSFLLGLGDLASVLDDKGLLIERIGLNSGELEVRLKSSQDIDVPQTVANLEAKPSLTNVNIGLAANDTVVVTADMVAPYAYENTPIEPGAQQ